MTIEEYLRGQFKELHMPDAPVKNEGVRRIAVFMHTLYTGGSQMAMLEAIRLMKKEGWQAWILSVHGGVCMERFLEEGVPCCIIGQPENSEDLRTMLLTHFDAVWINSVAAYYFVYFFINTQIPVYWWIHETESALKGFNGFFPHPQGLSDNITFVAPSTGVQEAIRHLYKKEARLLPLTIRDAREAYPVKTDAAKVRFFIPGTYMPIKGYDLMLKAISMLPAPFLQKCTFTFCGFTYPEDEAYRDRLFAIAGQMPQVKMLHELSRDELYAHYAACDCVVAPSRLDSGPMTVVEAMMFVRLTIVSDAAGIASLMTDCANGFVFPSEDASELMKRILLVINDRDALSPVAAAGRALYETHFSPEATAGYLSSLLNG